MERRSRESDSALLSLDGIGRASHIGMSGGRSNLFRGSMNSGFEITRRLFDSPRSSRRAQRGHNRRGTVCRRDVHGKWHLSGSQREFVRH